MEKVREKDQYHDGFSDGFVPVEPLDLSKINSFDALLRAYQSASFGARRLGDAAQVLEEMVRDPDCFTVLTVSGAAPSLASPGNLSASDLAQVAAIVNCLFSSSRFAICVAPRRS